MARVDKAELKRRAIIEAGSTLFSRFGYEKTTLEDIAKKARMGKATLYYYFPGGKDAIFSAVLQFEVERLFQEILADMNQAKSAEGRLHAYVRARVRQYHRQVVNRGITDTVFDELIPLAESELRRYFDRELDVIQSLVAAAMREGAFAQGDSRLAARIVQAGMKSLTDDNPAHSSLELRESEIESFLAMLLNGLRVR